MLDYIRSLELIATSTLIGVAESNTTPVQPDSSRVCYIAGVAQNQTVTFENFIGQDGNPISVTTGDMEGIFVILMWNTQYWSAQTFSTNIISQTESATFYYRYNIRKTYESIALMNADVTSPIGTDGKYIKIGELVTVNNSTTPSENGFYSYEGSENGWQFQSSFNFQLSQTTGSDPNVAMSQKTATDNFKSAFGGINRYVIPNLGNNVTDLELVVERVGVTLNVNVTFSQFGLGGLTERENGFVCVPGHSAIALTNGQGIFFDTQAESGVDPIVVGYAFGGPYDGWQDTRRYVLLFVNLYAYLYSPQPYLQLVCDQKQFGSKHIKLNGGEIAQAIAQANNDTWGMDATRNAIPLGPNLAYDASVVENSNQTNVVASTFPFGGQWMNRYDYGTGKVGPLSYRMPVLNSKRVVAFFSIESNVPTVSVGLYFRNTNDTAWVKNENAVIKTVSIADGKKMIRIERDVEEGSGIAAILFGRTSEPTTAFQSGDWVNIGYLEMRGEGYPISNRQLSLRDDMYVITTENLPNIASIVLNGINVTVTFKETAAYPNQVTWGIGMIENRGAASANGFIWCSLSSDNFTIQLANGDGIVANVATGLVEKVAGVFGSGYKQFIDGDKILLYINLYGKLVSPHPWLQTIYDNVANGTANIKLNGGEIENSLVSKAEFVGEPIGQNPYDTPSVMGFSPHGIANAIVKGTTTAFGDTVNAYSESVAPAAVSTSGYGLSIDIPPCQRIRVMFQYRSNKALQFALYERNSGGWINNPGATVKTFPAQNATPIKNFNVIERTYEQGATQISFNVGDTALSPIGAGGEFELGFCQVFCYGVVGSGGDVEPVVINVAADGTGDFTSIRDAIVSIKDASAAKPYKVFVKNGYYEEIDIHSKEYVDVEGESRDGVTVYTDGLSTALSPDDYSWIEAYRGIPINTIPKAWKHQWILMNNVTVSNMTMIVNQTKYVIHQDSEGQAYRAVCKNCRLIREEDYAQSVGEYDQGLLNLVGVGAVQAQYQIYEDCVFEMRVKNLPNTQQQHCALLWHNWNNKTLPAGASLIRCKVFNTNLLNANDLGSNQHDVIDLIDCEVDNPNGGVYYTLTPGYYIPAGESSPTSDPTKIPYNIFLNIQNTPLNFAILGVGREKAMLNIQNAYTMGVLEAPAGIAIGQPLAKSDIGFSPAQLATDKGFVVAMEATTDAAPIFVDQGDIVKGLAIAGNYAIGDAIYINGGKFTKLANGNAVATCYSASNLTSDGMITIKKLK